MNARHMLFHRECVGSLKMVFSLHSSSIWWTVSQLLSQKWWSVNVMTIGGGIVCTEQLLHQGRKLMIIIFLQCNYCTSEKSRDMGTTYELYYLALNSWCQHDSPKYAKAWLPIHDTIMQMQWHLYSPNWHHYIFHKHIAANNVIFHIFCGMVPYTIQDQSVKNHLDTT